MPELFFDQGPAGGDHGDRYLVGLNEGPVVIDDQGGVGVDTLVLFTGDLADDFDPDWFEIDGEDLLIRIPAAGGEGWAVDIRIVNMSQSSGAIERIELWGGEGTRQTAPSLSLVGVWEELTRLCTCGLPDMDDFIPTPLPIGDGVEVFGTIRADTLTGTPLDDIFWGDAGNDRLIGGDGQDSLMGEQGADILQGADGHDLLVDDIPGWLGEDLLEGGAGDDTLMFFGAPASRSDVGDGGDGNDIAVILLPDRWADWRLLEHDGALTLRPNTGNEEGRIEIRNVETVAVLFGAGDDMADAGDHRAFLDGAEGNDDLRTGAGDDYLAGGEGDDNLYSGGGRDWIDGGDGDDYAEIDLSAEDGDLIYRADLAASYWGFTFANGTFVGDVERVFLKTGSGQDTLFMGAGDDRLDSGGGNDLFVSSLSGRDIVEGGEGRDRLIVDFSDTASRVRSSVTADGAYEIYAGSRYLLAQDRIHATGIEEVAVYGGSSNDVLRAGIGNDELAGNDGDDSLSGGAGDDDMFGGDGDDSLVLDAGVDRADGGEGRDYGVLSRRTSSLNFTIDLREMASETGQTLIDGTHARNIERWSVSLGRGADTVTSAVRGVQDIAMGKGRDHLIIDHSGWKGVLLAEAGMVEGQAAYLVALGNSFYAASDRILATEVEQVTIYGGISDDTLRGLQGADVLSGGAGADLLDGGLGADTYYVDDAGDIVVEENVEGIDLVFSTIDFSLAGQFIENLTLTGGADIDGTGNGLANRITGNVGANVIDGGLGADRMVGGWGDDTYYVDDAGDVVIEDSVDGTDLVYATISFVLGGQHIENLILTGGADIDGTGNGLVNRIIGNAGANVIDGGVGADRMEGGLGGDTYHVDDAGDVVIEANVAGVDTVHATVSFALGDQYIETLILDGSADINATGNNRANTLIGNAGANVLNGGLGADSMSGGAGSDTYHVQHAGDTVIEGDVAGVDLVLAAISFSLAGQHVENLTLTGALAIDGIGNGLDNVIVGNSAANALGGEAGADRLRGAGGADVLTGGDGADVFVFTSVSDSTLGAFDRIVDLSALDRIDLSAIDANTTAAGNQAFAIVDAFTNAAGQMTLAYSSISGTTTLLMDVNGDGLADMQIVADGDHHAFANFLF